MAVPGEATLAETHLGMPERTIQHWGQRGKIAKRGMLYRLADITSRDSKRAT